MEERRYKVLIDSMVLANICKSRRNHKLDECHALCDWIERLLYSELITGEEKEENIKTYFKG